MGQPVLRTENRYYYQRSGSTMSFWRHWYLLIQIQEGHLAGIVPVI